MNNQINQKWAKVVAKAWNDPKFKEKLLKNPNQAMKDEGIEPPKGMTYKVIENTENTLNLVLPKKPSSEIEEKFLSDIAAGQAAPINGCVPI